VLSISGKRVWGRIPRRMAVHVKDYHCSAMKRYGQSGCERVFIKRGKRVGVTRGCGQGYEREGIRERFQCEK
jgi:hypothetical protein